MRRRQLAIDEESINEQEEGLKQRQIWGREGTTPPDKSTISCSGGESQAARHTDHAAMMTCSIPLGTVAWQRSGFRFEPRCRYFRRGRATSRLRRGRYPFSASTAQVFNH